MKEMCSWHGAVILPVAHRVELVGGGGRLGWWQSYGSPLGGAIWHMFIDFAVLWEPLRVLWYSLALARWWVHAYVLWMLIWSVKLAISNANISIMHSVWRVTPCMHILSFKACKQLLEFRGCVRCLRRIWIYWNLNHISIYLFVCVCPSICLSTLFLIFSLKILWTKE